MRRTAKFATKAAIAAVVLAFGISGATAYASQPPPFEPGIDTGWDGVPNTIIGQGSDTTYDVMLALSDLYNNSPGCQVYSGTGCGTDDINDARYGSTNYDHDAVAQGYPTGSGAGINGLTTPANYAQGINFARSSRKANAGETAARTFWGYGVDGIAVISFGTRTGVSLTQANLNAIYHCQAGATDWSNFGQPAGTIVPWGMNSASGTAATFAGFVGFTSDAAGVAALNSQACVRLLSGPDGLSHTADDVPPFENDTKPILSDPAGGTTSNYLWWMSFGVYSSVPFKGSNPNATGLPVLPGANIAVVNGTTPSGGTILAQTYTTGLLRLIYHVTLNTDADCVSPAGGAGPCTNVDNSVFGATGGAGGAVREFTEFLCNPNSSQFGDEDAKAGSDRDAISGAQFRTAIVTTLNRNGFQQIQAGVNPVFSRSTGYACFVDTTT
jgi:ABC-type phosphate transport system substrate-binding protein